MNKDTNNHKKMYQKLLPFIHLWPAILTVVLVAVMVIHNQPHFLKVPKLLAAEQEEKKDEKKEQQEEQQENAAVEATVEAVEVQASQTEAFEEPTGGYKDGVYIGSATGFGGTIKVEVTIRAGKITAIRILDASGETPEFLNRAKAVIDRILSAGSPNVDVVSGATYSSNGIINAVKRALQQAAVSGGTAEPELVVEEQTPPAQQQQVNPQPDEELLEISADSDGLYKDGVYTGSAQGFGGEIAVQVEVKNGIIASIIVLSAEDETPSFLDKAMGVINSILSTQSTKVDVVSGATYSSKGIINAVRKALLNAIYNPEDPSAIIPPIEDDENTDPDGEENNKPDNQPDPDEEDPKQPDPDEEDPEQPDPDEQDPQQPGSDEETPSSIYKDGTYQHSVICTDQVLFDYTLQITLKIKDDKITNITVKKTEDRSYEPEDNDAFIDYALKGRTVKKVWYESVTKQMIDKQSTEHVDVVSGATYSSRAIIEGVQAVLDTARVTEE